MKSTVLATLAGLGIANSFNENDFLLNQASSNLQLNSNSAFNLGSGNSLFKNNMASSGFNVASSGGMGMGGAQNMAVTSFGSVNTGAQGLSSGTGLSNIGTGAVLVSPAITGTQIKSGAVITNGNFPKADIGLLSSVSSSTINNNLVASGIINNAKTISNQFGANRSINSLFYKLPSSNQIDNMILSADAAALIQTIQAIGTSDAMPCDQRIAYLLEMLGRLKAAVAKKTFANSQVRIIIDAATKQITRLTGLIDANNAAISKLNINGLKKQLQELLNILQDIYIKYNNVQAQIPTIQAQINGSDQQIIILNKNSDAIRNSIANDKIKLTTITTDINSVQNRIRQLKDRQTALQASISRGQVTITKNDAAIQDINARIDALQTQIKELTSNADRFSSQAKDLQVKVSRLRTDISVNEAKKARLLKDNLDLADRLAIEKKKNVPEDLNAIQEMITALKNLVPKVQSQIDRHYYFCFGQGKVQVRNIGGVVVYVVRGQAFGNYLKNLYGQSIRIPQVSGNVMLNRVNIFDQDWSGAFGYPFNQNAFGTSDLSLGGSFGCLNPSALVTGSGTITEIGANYIQTLDHNSNQKHRFKLGSCSRLESTRKVPAIGQNLYFSGVPDGSAFNLYTGSCFD